MLCTTVVALTGSRNPIEAVIVNCQMSAWTDNLYERPMIRRLVLRIVLALSVSMPAVSAKLFYMDHDAFMGKYIGPTGPLVISGDIARGDYERLLAKIEDDEDRFLSQNKIIVASTAGDMSEGMKISKLIKALHSEVSVRPLTGNCVGRAFSSMPRPISTERMANISSASAVSNTKARYRACRRWRLNPERRTNGSVITTRAR
jgi:hypothetical protein